MSLEQFLHSLHFDTTKARPPDWEVDWADSPFPYKLYRGLPTVPLSAEVPISLEQQGVAADPTLRGIAHFLWYAYGLTQWSQSVFPVESGKQGIHLMQSNRRFVPSGGALYPNELYVYLKLTDLPAGVYHYDVAHHRLVLLREGDFDSYVSRALGSRCEVESCFGTVFVSTRFWKNFYKYNNFSYRLQGLDTGVLVGQLLEVAKRFGFYSGIYYRYLDRAVGHLLGLSEHEESVYAVVPLTTKPAMTWFAGEINGVSEASASELCRELPVVRHEHYMGSRRVKEYPMLIRMNEACLLESQESIRPMTEEKMETGPWGFRTVQLPRVERLKYDYAAVCSKRYSPDMDFVLDKVSLSKLSGLLQEAMTSFPYYNDLDGIREKPAQRVHLYVCLYNVEGIPNGAYHYDSTAHALQEVRSGDHRRRLQEAMSLHNVNLFQVPICFHVAGDRDHLRTRLGYRGYRIQQMEAGILVGRLLHGAFACGIGGHPLLGYDVNVVDEIYMMAEQRLTSLIQLPVGPYRPRPRLTGGLHT